MVDTPLRPSAERLTSHVVEYPVAAQSETVRLPASQTLQEVSPVMALQKLGHMRSVGELKYVASAHSPPE